MSRQGQKSARESWQRWKQNNPLSYQNYYKNKREFKTKHKLKTKP